MAEWYDLADCDEPPRRFRGRGLDSYDRGPPCPTGEHECGPWRAPPEFLLGVHRLNWCWEGNALGPLFINVHLMLSKAEDAARADFGEGLVVRPSPLLPATQVIGLDSGGYTELEDHGRWRWSVREHVWLVRRMCRELRTVSFAAPMDWPCGPAVLRSTGLSPAEHMDRTLRSYLELAELAPEIPWAPTLQGAEPDDYLRHVEAYQRAGVDLWTFDRVLLGSIAARDTDPRIVRVAAELQASGLALHGLGAKELGLATLGPYLTSADSLAWSSRGRSRTNNLRKALGIQYRDADGAKVRKLSQAELCALVEAAPARIRDSDDAQVLLTYGRDQDLANAQGYAEHWRVRQLRIFGGELPETLDAEWRARLEQPEGVAYEFAAGGTAGAMA